MRTPGQAREVLRAGDELPRAPRGHAAAAPRRSPASPIPNGTTAPGAYRRPGAIVRESARRCSAIVTGSTARSHVTPARPARAHALRAAASAPHPDRPSGDGAELDIAEYVNAARRLARRRRRGGPPVRRRASRTPRTERRAARRRQRLDRQLGLGPPAHRRRRKGCAARGVRGARRARRPVCDLRVLPGRAPSTCRSFR